MVATNADARITLTDSYQIPSGSQRPCFLRPWTTLPSAGMLPEWKGTSYRSLVRQSGASESSAAFHKNNLRKSPNSIDLSTDASNEERRTSR